MDQESEGTNLVIFMVGGVVLLLLLLGGGAFFFLMSSHEDSAREEALKEIDRGLKEFKPEPVFPAEVDKAHHPTAPDGESNTFQTPTQPKAQIQELPKGPDGQPPPAK